ncbi:MAG: hypothetical protein AAGA43_02175 [Bacteroidota bacterium]
MIKKIFVATVLSFICFSCEVDDVPETDNIPPGFSFRISGDGFEQTFTQDDNFEDFQLNLRGNTEYDFVLTGSDQGGVRSISFQFTNESMQLISTVPAPWEINDNGFSTTIEFDGDRNNPTTGSILAGTFITTGQVSQEFQIGDGLLFQVTDFGGSDGTSRNSTSADLTILIGEHTTEIITR